MAAHRLSRKKWLHAIVAIGLLIGFIWLITGCSEKQAGKKDAAKTAAESKTAESQRSGIKDSRRRIARRRNRRPPPRPSRTSLPRMHSTIK